MGQPGSGIVVTPDSKTVYAVGTEGGLKDFHGTVTPIQQDHALRPIFVPQSPDGITLAPDGRTGYVVSRRWPPRASKHPRDTITPINLRSGTTLPPVMVRGSSNGFGSIAVAPGGKTAYFLDTLLGVVTPIHLATHTAGRPILSAKGSYTMLFGQGASIGYLIESDGVVPLNTATNTTLPSIKLPAVMDWGEAMR